jgi:hypothetical protein
MTKTVHTPHGLGLDSTRLDSTWLTKTVHTPHGLGLGLDTPTARPGPARRASVRARVARPSPFTNFTSGPPLVHPLS